MEMIISGINWPAVFVGAVIAYVLGAFWYADTLFGKKWKKGIGKPAVANTPMAYGMLAQAFGTIFLAWLVGVAYKIGSISLLVLITLTLATLIKANGFFAGKTKYAIATETLFVVAMVLVMTFMHFIF